MSLFARGPNFFASFRAISSPSSHVSFGCQPVADDAPGELPGVVDQIGAGKEAAHGMSQQEIGNAGETAALHDVQLVHVGDDVLPAVLLGEKALVGGVGDGFPVAEVIVPDDGEAVARKELRELVIPVDILRDAVGKLQDRFRRPIVGQPAERADRIFPGG